MRRILFLFVLSLLLAAEGTSASAIAMDLHDSSGATRSVSASESQNTMKHWKMARTYQDQMRLELAKHHYLLALATCRSPENKDSLQRDLQGLDLLIRTMR